MTKKVQHVLITIGMLALFAVVILTSPAFDKCMEQQAEKESKQASKKHPLIVSGDCFFVAFHESNAIISALAALVVAWLTLNIARANDTMAEANEQLAKITGNQETISKIQGRAYLFGGGPYGARKDGGTRPDRGFNDPNDFIDKKFLTMQNFGKTPAIITGVWWGLCKVQDYPKGASMDDIINGRTTPVLKVTNVETVGEFIPETGEAKWLPYRHVTFFRSEHVGEVFFGKITYTDVFGDPHYSTFKLLLNKDGMSDPFDGGYKEYN